MSLLTDFYQ